MSADESSAVVCRVTEAINRKDLATLSTHPGLAEFTAHMRAFVWPAFPDVRGTVVDEVAAGEWVAQRLTLRGTHQGPLLSIAPTSKTITWEVISMCRVANGTVVDSHAQADLLGMLRQLGGLHTMGG